MDENETGEPTNEIRDEEKHILRVRLGRREVQSMLCINHFNRVSSPSDSVLGGIHHSWPL
jgi:hypothetical protein